MKGTVYVYAIRHFVRYIQTHGLFPLVLVMLAIPPSSCYGARSGNGYLHRSHTRIVDGNGQPVLLRGINLADWLNILPSSITRTDTITKEGDEDASSMDDLVDDAVGPDLAQKFFDAWRQNFITKSDIVRIKGWGFNCVRIPLDYRLFVDPSTLAGRDVGFKYLDPVVSWCAESRIYVVLSMDSVPGGNQSERKGNIFTDQDHQQLLAYVWKRIARHYATNAWIAGYDLVDEPDCNDKTSHILLGMLYRKLGAAIRATDRAHMLILEGDNRATDLDEIGIGSRTARLWDSNVAYSVHAYANHLPIEATDPLEPNQNEYSFGWDRLITTRMDVPLMVGAFGINSNTWINWMRAYFERPDAFRWNGKKISTPISWCFWSYKSPAIWSVEEINMPDDVKPLIAYWNSGRPAGAKPTMSDAFAGLMDLAQKTNASACPVNSDVLDAIGRPDFQNRSVPYRSGLAIPGRIEAAYYDMGREGLAYHDWDSVNTGGDDPSTFQTWNKGLKYRNDGVDLFPDAGVTGYAIGGICPGEWVQYTVNANRGVYQISINYSAINPGCQMRVLFDDADITGPIDLPVTGDWHNYATTTVDNIKIADSGTHVIKLRFDTYGFNVKWFEFDLDHQ